MKLVSPSGVGSKTTATPAFKTPSLPKISFGSPPGLPLDDKAGFLKFPLSGLLIAKVIFCPHKLSPRTNRLFWLASNLLLDWFIAWALRTGYRPLEGYPLQSLISQRCPVSFSMPSSPLSYPVLLPLAVLGPPKELTGAAMRCFHILNTPHEAARAALAL